MTAGLCSMFRAQVSESMSSSVTERGIYFYDPAEGLSEVIRVGDSLGEGVVSSLEIFSEGPLNASGLNNREQVAFYFERTDGIKGIAIWTQLADYTGDGMVTEADLTDPTVGWLTTYGSTTDGGSFLRWQRQFESKSAIGALSAVPEPSSSVMLLLASIAMLRREASLLRRRA